MALSPKQLAMAWINEKLDPSRIEVEDSEINRLNGGKHLSQEVIEKARQFVLDDLAKVKVRYQQYTEKYVGEVNVNNQATHEETPDGSNLDGGDQSPDSLYEVQQPVHHTSDGGIQ